MGRRKRSMNYKRLEESDTDDEDFVPDIKKNKPQSVTKQEKQSKRLSPEEKFERDIQAAVVASKKQSLDMSIVIGNPDAVFDEDDDNDPNVIKDTIMEKQSTLPGQPTQIVNTPKENTSPSVLSFNVTTSPQKPSAPAETSSIPRPSYTSMAPPGIRLGLSRKAVVKPLHLYSSNGSL